MTSLMNHIFGQFLDGLELYHTLLVDMYACTATKDIQKPNILISI
jgi:hypothetical protein